MEITKTICAAALVGAALALQGCANTTGTGSVGIERSQLLFIPTSTINKTASDQYFSLVKSAQKKGALITKGKLFDRINKISFQLIGHVGTFREDAYDWHWSVSLFKSDQVNAFCAPGGKIGIFTGIIEKLNLNDDEIAAVIGHEIAHALREHSREKISQQTLGALVSTGIAAATGIPSGIVSTGSDYLVHLPNSRSMELEADIIGLELMARAGFNPANASSLWKKMAAHSEQQGNKINPFFSTHPASEERVKALETNTSKVIHLYNQTKFTN